MKKIGIINSQISAVIARLGHTDMLTIADAGLPIPETTQRIDLALTKGVPGFTETLNVVLTEMCVEKAVVAQEILEHSPNILEEIKRSLGDIPIEKIAHVEFKKLTGSSRAVIRTGEFTPYANIILISGVWGFD